MADTELDMRKRRALYRATHRGSKELDFLLGRFASSAIEEMGAADIALLERLIEAPDPSLAASIYDGDSLGEAALDELIGRVRRFHGFPSGPATGHKTSR